MWKNILTENPSRFNLEPLLNEFCSWITVRCMHRDISRCCMQPLTSIHDSGLARFCILVNACHRKYLGSHFTPVKTFDRHTGFYTSQCMKCNKWQVFSFKFHENSEGEKKWKSSPDLQDSWILIENCWKVYWCKLI